MVGLTFDTVLTLVLVPVLYSTFYRLKALQRRHPDLVCPAVVSVRQRLHFVGTITGTNFAAAPLFVRGPGIKVARAPD